MALAAGCGGTQSANELADGGADTADGGAETEKDARAPRDARADGRPDAEGRDVAVDSRAKDGPEDTTGADSTGDSTAPIDGGPDGTLDSPSDVTTTTDSESLDSAKMDAPADGGTVDTGTADAAPRESGIESGAETGSADSAADAGADSPVESAATDAPAESGSDAGCATSTADSGVGGTLNWANAFGISGPTDVVGVAADPTTGAIAITGVVVGTTNFGGGVISGGDAGAGAFLAGFNSAGSYQWARIVAGDQVSPANLAIDGSGNVLMLGTFQGPTDFGGGSVASSATGDLFLAEYSSTGSFAWIKHFDAAPNGCCGAVHRAVFDTSGNIYLVGELEGTALDLGCGALPGGMSMFVAKFNSSGVCIWSNGYGPAANGGSNYTQSETITLDPSGDVIVGGGFYGTIDFGTGSRTAPGIGMDVFVQKLTSGGAVTWAKTFGIGASVAQITGIGTDSCGNIVADGTFSGTIDFGCGTLTESGDTGSGDVFIAKFDPSATCMWSNSFGDPNGQIGGPLAVDAHGGSTITGSFNGMVNFGTGALIGDINPQNSMYIARFDSKGTCAWAYGGGPPSTAANSDGVGVASSSDNVITVGALQIGNVDLAGTTIVTSTSLATYIASFAP